MRTVKGSAAASNIGRAQATRERIRAMRLSYHPPLDWSGLLAFYARRAITGIETAADGRYRRSVRIDGNPAWIEVKPVAGDEALELTVNTGRSPVAREIADRVRRMFDLETDPAAITAVFDADPLLGPIAADAADLRMPGAWDPFEVAVRAILGQQISVAAARTLAQRMVEAFGDHVATAPAGLQRLFPIPARLADAPLEEFGVFGGRARAIRNLSARVAEGSLDLEGAGLAARLLELPGIGDWTAQYIALRSGQDADAFPAADLGLLRGADPEGRMTPAQLRRRAEAWRPWRGYAALCLWRRYAARPSRRKETS
jgi:DNA-3-methyladenine glycosylase II